MSLGKNGFIKRYPIEAMEVLTRTNETASLLYIVATLRKAGTNPGILKRDFRKHLDRLTTQT